jgi:hypothetical protein
MSPRLVPLARLLGLSVLCVGLSLGCGGNTTPPQPPANPPPDAAASTVTVDRATQVRADGAERVSITVTVKQADGTPMQGRTVRVAVSGDGNTVTQPAGTTNASGVATASVVSTSAGSKQVTASVDTADGAVTLSARPTIEFISPRPTRVSFTAAALSATAGVPQAGLDVALVDAAGRTVTSATDEVTLALAAGPGGATPQGTLTVRAVAGVARFNAVVLTRAGTGYQWRATAAGLEGGTSATFAVAPAAAATVEVAGLPEAATAGVAQSAEVTLRDEFGNVATGYTGTLAVSSSDAGASLPAGHTFTAADAGRFTFTGITLRRAGTQRVTLQDTAVAALTAGRDVAVAAAAPAALAFVTVPAGGSVRTALGPVTVALQDAFGNPTPAGAPAVTLALVQGGATLGGVTEVAPVAGLATFSNLQVDGEGGFQLRATASGLTAATSGGTLDIIDDVAPARPTLATGASSARGVTVTWTAVGDDRDAGRATSQELRYASAPILTDADFEQATPVQGLGAPAVAGTAESFTLTGLLPSRTYHVALRVTDNRDQSSRSASLPVQTANAQVASVVFSTQPQDGTAGQALAQVTVSLLDDQGDVVTTATSPVTLRLVGSDFFEPVTVEALAGVATFIGLRVDVAGRWAFQAHANNLVSEQSRVFTLQPGTVRRLALRGLVAPVIAGASGSLELVAVDAYDNLASGYTGRVRFTSSDAEADLPEEYTFTAADAGRHVFSGVVLYTAGFQRVSVTDVADATLTAGFEVEVVGDSATRLELTGLPAAVVAGDAPGFTVTARDRYGNIASGYRGTVRFTSGDGQAVLPADYTFNTEDAGQQRLVATLATAGTQSVTVTDTANTLLTATASTEVAPGAATRMTLALSSDVTAAGQPVSATVTLRDVYDNVATGYRGTVGLGIPEDRDATSEPESHAFTEADAGQFTFSVRLARVQRSEVVARDTQNAGLTASAFLQVRPGVLAELRVTSADGATTAGGQRSFEVTAYDRFGNLKTDYAGTVRTTSSDAQAAPLEEHAYVPADEGRHTFVVTFRTAGTQSATFTDAALNIAGTHEFTVEAAEPTRLVVVSAPETGTVRAALARTRVALRDAFGNTSPVSAPAVSLALEGAPEGVVLSGTRTTSPVDGVATFEDLSLNEEGSFVLVASTENPALGTANLTVSITDNLAPAPAAQLDAALEGDDSVRLSWRATGDDGSLGRAARYELRYSQEALTEDNFAQATRVTTGTPGDVGTQEQALAAGLSLGRTYHFGLRILDAVGNASALTLASIEVPDACAGYECAVRPPVCAEDGESLVTFEGTCVVRDGEPTCEYSPVSTPCPGEGAVCFEDACGTAAPPAPGELFISEVMHRPGAATEYIELSSRVDRLLNLDGLALRYDDGVSPREFVLTPEQGHAVVGPNRYVVLARDADTETNGGVPVNFSYGDALPLGDSGQLTVRIGGAGGTVLDSLTYTASFPQTTGRSMNLSSTVVGSAASQFSWYWCDSSADIVSGGDRGTPGVENETCGVAITSPVDYCAIQFPKTIASPIFIRTAQTIYSRFYEDGVTNRNRGGNDGFPYITAELGYGTSAATPESWTWVPAPYNGGYSGAVPNDDETMGTLNIPTAGNYLYGFRYRFTQGPAAAQAWVYCDQNGVVTSSGSANYGTVTVQRYPVANHVVISEISAGRGSMGSQTTDEFIELYNPTDADVNIGGWLVQYRSTTGATYTGSVTIPPGRVIRAHGYFLLAHSNFTGGPTPDVTYTFDMSASTATSAGAHVRIGPGLTNNNNDTAVDRLGWGAAAGPEGTAAPAHPAAGGSLERKALPSSTAASMVNDAQDGLRGNGSDTNNNSADFVQRTARQPQNSSSQTERP